MLGYSPGFRHCCLEKAKPTLLSIAVETGTVEATLRGLSTSLLRPENPYGALHHGSFAGTVPATQRIHVTLGAVRTHTPCAREEWKSSPGKPLDGVGRHSVGRAPCLQSGNGAGGSTTRLASVEEQAWCNCARRGGRFFSPRLRGSRPRRQCDVDPHLRPVTHTTLVAGEHIDCLVGSRIFILYTPPCPQRATK
ncbi:hypothetical protein NDU88_004398 [Pleurodeles waltl]|uniref:Uncharacterized protein n=1 Tax=Pleurodeles waltl TaxID=8319 RepID=A0AAV7VJ60_PLEWA|nr:hypothetical protein NDU88_004398 [Pleurodeles waltl]